MAGRYTFGMLEAISVWAAIAFGGVQPPTMEFGGHVVAYAPIVSITHGVSNVLPIGYTAGGMSLPHVAFVDPGGIDPQHTARHERVHLRQYDALGPGAVLALALGGGEGMEDYVGDGTMYDPAGSPEANTCPVVRVEAGRAAWFPCWSFGD